MANSPQPALLTALFAEVPRKTNIFDPDPRRQFPAEFTFEQAVRNHVGWAGMSDATRKIVLDITKHIDWYNDLIKGDNPDHKRNSWLERFTSGLYDIAEDQGPTGLGGFVVRRMAWVGSCIVDNLLDAHTPLADTSMATRMLSKRYQHPKRHSDGCPKGAGSLPTRCQLDQMALHAVSAMFHTRTPERAKVTDGKTEPSYPEVNQTLADEAREIYGSKQFLEVYHASYCLAQLTVKVADLVSGPRS